MVKSVTADSLLVFVWQHRLWEKSELFTRNGEPVEVIDPGRRNSGEGPPFVDAQIRIGQTCYVGAVAVHRKSSDWGYYKRNYDASYDSVILHVVGEDDRIVRKVDDSLVLSLCFPIPERLLRAYRTVRLGADTFACGYHMARQMNEIELTTALTRLMVDRLERKFKDVMAIYAVAEKNWYETFHILLFRSMGLGKNKEIYMSLARSVPYAKLCQERGEVENIEAMLFGVAGLLDSSLYDEYKTELTRRFEMLRHRHQLRVMTYCQWSDKGIRPYNFVPKRLAQLASMINDVDFTLTRVLQCETYEELRRLFQVGLPEYWKRSFTFAARTERKQQTVGEVALDILMINLIAPILFAYGRVEGRPELEERAVDLLYRTKPEKNRHTEGWRIHGVRIEHALASQALIQLRTEYCLAGRCTECFLGTRLLKSSL